VWTARAIRVQVAQVNPSAVKVVDDRAIVEVDSYEPAVADSPAVNRTRTISPGCTEASSEDYAAAPPSPALLFPRPVEWIKPVGAEVARGGYVQMPRSIRARQSRRSLDGWSNVGAAFGQDSQDVAAQGREVAGVVGAQELSDG
jgi:hypothetical protein